MNTERKFLKIIVLLVLMNLALFVGQAKAESSALNRIASFTVGRSITVKCLNAYELRNPNAAGYVFENDPNTIYMKRLYCIQLNKTIKGSPPTQASSWALLTILHESAHLMGIFKEGKASCFAFQEFPETARKLKIKGWYAFRMYRIALALQETLGLERPEYALPVGCHFK